MILDEAYCEFNLLQDPDESIELLDRHPNLVLLRTFSKVYGLCGLRVGFALCGSEDFRIAVDQVRQPFFCNAAAQAAAIEALKHQDEVARRVERNLAERLELEDGLRRLGLAPAESQANFVWVDLPEGAESEPALVGALAERGVLVALGRGARPRGRAAGDGRDRGRERPLPRAARRAAAIGRQDALQELPIADPRALARDRRHRAVRPGGRLGARALGGTPGEHALEAGLRHDDEHARVGAVAVRERVRDAARREHDVARPRGREAIAELERRRAGEDAEGLVEAPWECR